MGFFKSLFGRKKEPDGFEFDRDDKERIANALANSAVDALKQDDVHIGRKERKLIDKWSRNQIDDCFKPQGTIIDPDYTPPKPPKIQDNGEQTHVKCPHCNHAFEKMPRAKRKCPECKMLVFPRRPPGKKWKRLVTEEQVRKWAKSENRKQAKQWANERRLEYRSELNAGYIANAFDLDCAPDCCPDCQKIAGEGPYKLDDLPWPVIDTHPFCRCAVTPHI